MHKNSKKKLQSKKEVVHTRLDSPIYLRKLVLRAAIDSTKALKDYNELKMIREEKKRQIKKKRKKDEDYRAMTSRKNKHKKKKRSKKIKKRIRANRRQAEKPV